MKIAQLAELCKQKNTAKQLALAREYDIEFVSDRRVTDISRRTAIAILGVESSEDDLLQVIAHCTRCTGGELVKRYAPMTLEGEPITGTKDSDMICSIIRVIDLQT